MIATRHERIGPAAGQEASRATRDPGPRVAQLGLAGVLILFAYEWFLSGLDKVLSADFRTNLGTVLQQALRHNQNRWYVDALRRFVLPHAAAVAIVVEIGELLVAVGFIAGAILWLTGHRMPGRWAQALHLATIVALLGSTLMTANYYFMAGNTWPWLKPGDPFDEGLGIDGLLTLIALALLAVHLAAWRMRRSLAR